MLRKKTFGRLKRGGNKNLSIVSVTILTLLVSISPSPIVAPVSANALSQISFRDKIYDIAVKGDEVFVVGFPGILLHSRDRGDSFTSIRVPTDDALFAIDIAADGFGATVGRDGLVLITRDNGKSWKKSNTQTKEHLFSVSVVSGGKVWAVGHFGTIIHSADDGKSWAAQTYDSTLPEPREEADPIKGQEDDLTAEEENEGAIDEARLNAVTFVNERTGWITGEFGLVLHTVDGGVTWKRQRSNVSLLMFAIRAIDARTLVAVGSEGTLIKTEDGGLSWKQVNTRVKEHLLDIYLLEDRQYIVGYDGLILVQENRESNYRRVSAGVYSWLGSVAFIDAQLGFAAGGRGYLLKTINGGRSWRPLSE